LKRKIGLYPVVQACSSLTHGANMKKLILDCIELTKMGNLHALLPLFHYLCTCWIGQTAVRRRISSEQPAFRSGNGRILRRL